MGFSIRPQKLMQFEALLSYTRVFIFAFKFQVIAVVFLMMDPAVIIILLLYRIYSAQAVKNSELLVVSAEPGKAVTLTCPPVDDSDADVRMWYKQRLEHAPLEVGSKLRTRESIISAPFDRSRFKIDRIAGVISLSIERVTKEDEGMYFCAAAGEKTMSFSNATFLAVTEDPVDPVMLALAVFSAVCVAVICAQTILIYKLRKSEHRAGEKAQEGAVSERTTRQITLLIVPSSTDLLFLKQDSDSEEFDFTALRFSEKMKRRALKEKVFTRVRFFPVSDYRAVQ
ncbi:hypothetical protein MHYP_G00107910 [Metynnis hypsauchen]